MPFKFTFDVRSGYVQPGTLRRRMYKNIRFVRDSYSRRLMKIADSDREETAYCAEAQVITSQLEGSDFHAPVIDLDIPHALVPSTTPGHSHLYLDVPMTARQHKKLLKVLAEVGVIEEGYAKASIAKGYGCVRTPWTKKDTAEKRTSYW